MTGAVLVASAAAAYQSGLPLETLWPSIANRSLTMKLRPASGPALRPMMGCFKLCGTSAPTGSSIGTEAIGAFSSQGVACGRGEPPLVNTPYNAGTQPINAGACV